jgi:hypothetical protein
MIHLSQTRVDETHPRSAVDETLDLVLDLVACEAVEGVRGTAPFCFVFVFEAAHEEELGAKFAGAEAHVISPKELEADGLRAFIQPLTVAFDAGPVWIGTIFETEEGIVDLTRGDASLNEVGRKLGGEIKTEKPITGVFIGIDTTAGNEVLYALQGF